MKRTRLIALGCIIALLALPQLQAHAEDEIGAAEARAIAKDAYIYGFPLVDGYRILHAYFVDRDNPEYKAPWNQIKNIPRVYTPDDKAVQTPNSDTPYSFLGMDLRAEPIVLTVPPIEKDRYFSIQLVDLYTHNFDYIGSRATGNGGGNFLIAGPGWNGEVPAGVTKVMRSETELALAIYRTQLFNPGDLDKVKAIQAGYKVQPLSAFLGQSGPKTAPTIDFIKPLTPETQKTSPEFFNVLNFVLKFCPTVPSEKELMARFAKIGVGAGQSIDTSTLSPEIKAAIEQGMADAWTEMAKLKKRFDAGEVTSGDVFGTREYLKNNYLYRMTAAALGIYGNSKQEAMYPAVFRRRRRPEAGRRHKPLHSPLRAGSVAARQRILVADDVRAPVKPAGGQSAQPLFAQLANAAAVQEGCRRRTDIAHPE